MSHHKPFQSLSPLTWSDLSPESFPSLMNETFSNAQILIDSIPPLASSSSHTTRHRSQTAPVSSQPTSESLSPDVLKLRKDWSALKPMAASSNPHNITVYKLSAKDGKGAWFGRKSIHYGYNFEQWEAALRKEFGETLKRGEKKNMPGQGNIRGIGAEKKVEKVDVPGVGTVEVFLVSARFPGPTTPRDFLALHMTPEAAKGEKGERQFMLISRPCEHGDCPPRSGFIRGQYESVEVIREVKVDGKRHGERKTMSSTDLGKDGAAASLVDGEGVEGETAIEWLMVTRSDPGGSVPRFMVEKGTPGGIVSDAGKFIEWFEHMCEEEETECEESGVVEEKVNGAAERKESAVNMGMVRRKSSRKAVIQEEDHGTNGEKYEEIPQPSGFYGMIASALEAAGSVVANKLPGLVGSSVGTGSDVDNVDEVTEETDDASSEASFASAQEDSTHDEISPPPFDGAKINGLKDTDAASTRSSILSEDVLSNTDTPTGRGSRQHEKELRKLQARMRKAQEKLEKGSRRHRNHSNGDKEEEALAKLREKHEREVAKQEEKYRRELQRLADKRAAEERKAEDRKKKQAEKEERANIQMELERTRAERDVALKQIEILKGQVGELQTQNTKLVARLGREGIVLAE
ncbi:hypothetical protein QBC43DRAFT_283835 [Cladorrhinum sp. PSN259]|nr:hypothetical protein QBC43DRAFT_283835 [Cladorrhinum sp. PSN259]